MGAVTDETELLLQVGGDLICKFTGITDLLVELDPESELQSCSLA